MHKLIYINLYLINIFFCVWQKKRLWLHIIHTLCKKNETWEYYFYGCCKWKQGGLSSECRPTLATFYYLGTLQLHFYTSLFYFRIWIKYKQFWDKPAIYVKRVNWEFLYISYTLGFKKTKIFLLATNVQSSFFSEI